MNHIKFDFYFHPIYNLTVIKVLPVFRTIMYNDSALPCSTRHLLLLLTSSIVLPVFSDIQM
jgi:hypothetical protein